MTTIRARAVTAALLLALSANTPRTATGQMAQVERTGQAACWDASGTPIACAGTGQDGALQEGIALPDPRFTDNGDGTVTDALTGLLWLKDANCFGARTWSQALTDANTLASGSCGLTDGSAAADWRLPNVKELRSLTHSGFSGPALSDASGASQWTENNPFSGVQSASYWTSSTRVGTPATAWFVNFSTGGVGSSTKTGTRFAWPVRGGP